MEPATRNGESAAIGTVLPYTCTNAHGAAHEDRTCAMLTSPRP